MVPWTAEVCQTLCELGVPSCPYHAGLPARVRGESFTKWMHGECQLIVATVAFGMGIDKRDVRFVFHIDMPSSIEKYHQEIGRAGRDGRPCRCILWFSRADAASTSPCCKFCHSCSSNLFGIFGCQVNRPMQAFRFQVKRNKEMSQKQYEVKRCEDAGKFFGDETCRHAGLLKHFGEKPSFQNCGACAACLDLPFRVQMPPRFEDMYLGCLLSPAIRVGSARPSSTTPLDLVACSLRGPPRSHVCLHLEERLHVRGDVSPECQKLLQLAESLLKNGVAEPQGICMPVLPCPCSIDVALRAGHCRKASRCSPETQGRWHEGACPFLPTAFKSHSTSRLPAAAALCFRQRGTGAMRALISSYYH